MVLVGGWETCLGMDAWCGFIKRGSYASPVTVQCESGWPENQDFDELDGRGRTALSTTPPYELRSAVCRQTWRTKRCSGGPRFARRCHRDDRIHASAVW